jgi:hypothetical protein
MGLLGCSEVKINTDIPCLGSDFKTRRLEQILKPHLEVLREDRRRGLLHDFLSHHSAVGASGLGRRRDFCLRLFLEFFPVAAHRY